MNIEGFDLRIADVKQRVNSCSDEDYGKLVAISRSLLDLPPIQARDLLGRVSLEMPEKGKTVDSVKKLYYEVKAENVTDLKQLKELIDIIPFTDDSFLHRLLAANLIQFDINKIEDVRSLADFLNSIDSKFRNGILSELSGSYFRRNYLLINKENFFQLLDSLHEIERKPLFERIIDNCVAAGLSRSEIKSKIAEITDRYKELNRDELLWSYYSAGPKGKPVQPSQKREERKADLDEETKQLLAQNVQMARDFIPQAWFERPIAKVPEPEQKDIDEAVRLINSDEGLAATKESLIFSENGRFPNACLNAYMQKSVTLNQLVSAVQLFLFLQDYQIKDPSLIKRKPLSDEQKFPQKVNEPKSESHFYEVKIPVNSLKEGVREFFLKGKNPLLPAEFTVQEDGTVYIPSFSSMQEYLDRKFGENAIQLHPRWGITSMNEVFEQELKSQRVFGLMVEPEKILAHGSEFGAYGFSLHDFYHAWLVSQIPRQQREAFLEIAVNLLNAAAKADEPLAQNLRDTAWEFVDMEFKRYVDERIDDTTFYKSLIDKSDEPSLRPYLIQELWPDRG